jgi:hypothetical protein
MMEREGVAHVPAAEVGKPHARPELPGQVQGLALGVAGQRFVAGGRVVGARQGDPLNLKRKIEPQINADER